MAEIIRLRKGLDIKLLGSPEKVINTVKTSETYALCPDDFTGVTPKPVVKEQQNVKAGEALFIDKNHPEVKFVSPVSGEVVTVTRGARRKVLNIVVKPDANQQFVEFGKKSVQSLSGSEIKSALLESGLFGFFRQRPYDVVANPEDSPRSIFVSAFDSKPLSPDFEFILSGNELDFQTGLSAIAKIAPTYLGISSNQTSQTLTQAKNVDVYAFKGAHPAGNVGVQINHIKPINKGEQVWTVSAYDLIVIGRALAGKVDFSRIITVAGSEIVAPAYAKVLPGSSIASVVAGKVKGADYTQRFIAGNVLTGQNAGKEGTVGFYDNTVTVIPDGGDTDEMFGWITPGLNRYSTS